MKNIINIHNYIYGSTNMYFYAASKPDGSHRYDNYIVEGYNISNAACKAEHECRGRGMKFINVRTYQEV